MIHVGFTGTRYGCTDAQRDMLRHVLERFRDHYGLVNFHQGQCVGADEEAARIANDFAVGFWVIAHPPTDEKHMSREEFYQEIREPKEYHDRNHDIVDESAALIACPDGHEKTRSGTWATVRYARKQKKVILIVRPDGSLKYDSV